jgi:superoxide oxidase
MDDIVNTTRSITAAQGYAMPVRWLHWISAAVILWAMISGFTVGNLPQNSELRRSITDFNVALTTIFIPVFALRIYVRLKLPAPAPLSASALHRIAAQTAHATLYILVSFVLFSGVFAVDHPASIFGIWTLQPVALPLSYRDNVTTIHSTACRALGGLVLLHVLAVFRHQSAGRDAVSRMTVPRFKSDDAENQTADNAKRKFW